MSIQSTQIRNDIGQPMHNCSSDAAEVTAGQFSSTKSITFGASKGVIVGDILHYTVTTPFSFSGFVKSSSSATGKRIIASYDGSASPMYKGWAIAFQTFVYFFEMVDSSLSQMLQVNSTTNITDGNWHHVAVTYDGSELGAGVKIYVDNVLETMSTVSQTTAGGSIVNTLMGSIGSDSQLANSHIGQLSHFSTWTRVLTATEVGMLYNGKKPQNLEKLPFYNACDHWWPLGDGDNYPVTKDLVGAYSGSMMGMSTSSIVSDAP